jgi:hypothetical protein
VRRIALSDTEFADVTCGTIRLKLLKVGAIVTKSVRRIKVAMASGCPSAQLWGLAANASLPRTRAAHPPDTRGRPAKLITKAWNLPMR